MAYSERDLLVSLISKIYPSHLARHPDSDLTWENDWRNIVCVHLPTGQATWHIHDSELPFFAHLQMGENHWDGHSNQLKYERILEIRQQIAQEHDCGDCEFKERLFTFEPCKSCREELFGYIYHNWQPREVQP